MASSSGVRVVTDLYEQLKERDADRNASYDELLRFYAGSTLDEAKKQGFLSGIVKAVSSVWSAREGEEDTDLVTPINLIKPAIENKVAFLSLRPTVRVVEPPANLLTPAAGTPAVPGASATGLPAAGASPEMAPTGPTAPGTAPLPAPEAGGPPMPTSDVPATPPMPLPGATDINDFSVDFADRLEAVIESLLTFSNIHRRCRDVAWSMSAMDGAVIGVWPDFRHERPRIFTRTPQNFYPVSYDPDGLELAKALWVEVMNGHEIQARWGNDKYLGRKDVEVIQMIDEEKFYTVLDGKEFAHNPVDNMMGIVPIVCVGNLGLPGMVFGSTDLKDALPVAKLINRHVGLTEDMAAAMVNPTIVIRDPINVPPDLAIGRGGVATMGPQGSADVLGPIGLPNAWWSLANVLQNWFDVISDNPAVLRSEGAGSIITGKGFNAQMGPVAARMQTRLDIAMAAWKQVIKYTLLMWANFPGTQGKLKASGQRSKETYYIEATPQEFMVGGEMWTEIEVYLEAQNYMDRQGNAVELMQLYQNEILDWSTVADNIPQIRNKKRVRLAIDRDRQWKAEGLAMAQSVAQSGMTANVPLEDQQVTNYKMERGFQGEAGAPPGPEGEAGTASPVSAGPGAGQSGGGDLVGLLKEFFGSIPKLKGAVWFGGDPILAPQKFASDNWTVTVWVTDPQDKGTITNAARGVPEIYGHIVFQSGPPSPEEQAVQVSSGQQVGTPQEAAPQGGAAPVDSAGGLPPEMGGI